MGSKRLAQAIMIAALFVAGDGPYIGIPGIDPWTAERDARTYPGPHPVIAHPPCERWGRYWSGGPSARVRRKLGDDNGCFLSALESVRRYGGVLEHPASSLAWAKFGLVKPLPQGWIGDGIGFVCQVEQGNYGHRARKATWLYAVSSEIPSLIWNESTGVRMDEGFHSNEERARARAMGIKPLKRLSKRQRIHTPIEFRDLLIEIARGARLQD